ncbi:MAG TPA: IPT/TIG domain-containing protein [Vicinamibacterales bacterium]|nr:IPT/TIG domain-containing protein [Vicinamibacterales bacterium]
MPTRPQIESVQPRYACEGGRVVIRGRHLWSGTHLPRLWLGDTATRPAAASTTSLTFRVPAGVSGEVPLKVETGNNGAVAVDGASLHIGAPIATGLHQVDSPVFDAQGRLYVTYSGTRGQQVPVSIFRVSRAGVRESFSSAIVNPTAMAIGPDGVLYVSSRFEGNVYKVAEDGSATVYASELGVPCGLAFSPEGVLFVGDRSGTIFRIRKEGQPVMVAALPPSVAAFHLAFGPDGWIYVTAPTLTSRDCVYRVHPDGRTEVVYKGFGRPQGLTVDRDGVIYVVDAMTGASGLYRLQPGGEPELLVSGEGLVGVAFDPMGGLVLASNETAYRLDASVLRVH